MGRRYGIGEWYGKSFVKMTVAERREYAQAALSHKKKEGPLPCPFQGEAGNHPNCTKKGGVCSLRIYEGTGDGAAKPVEGPDGVLRAVCPLRFAQANFIFEWVGEKVIDTDDPEVLGQVRFLQRIRTDLEEAESSPKKKVEDVGNIDGVLIHPRARPMRWCALEVQAVYFSGEKMSKLFDHIAEFPSDALPFPDKNRHPDYRSSGPKRLMPQLQIKVPALRRWGKKMAVVVDEGFFKALGPMERVEDISNCDIVWFVVRYDEGTDPVSLVPGDIGYVTLERAVEGLTAGKPVTLAEFEDRIMKKRKEAGNNRKSDALPFEVA